MACIPDLPPTNPISALLVNSLGENFFPPYDANFQPVDHSKLTEEKFLKMNTPGGGKLKPIGDQNMKHISEYLTPISGILGSVFAFFAPLFIILDVIRALIDLLCALFNPVPLILTFVDLFINVVPPLIALYPPLSSILHALNVAKLLIAIGGSMAARLIPIISEVVKCALEIPAQLSEGNIAFVDSVSVKLCELFQDLANAIAGFGPIKFILELLLLFLELAGKLPCVPALPGIPGSPCCNAENCPPIIINPPTGEMEVLQTIYKFTLKDLAEFIFDILNIALEPISDFLNLIIDSVLVVIDGIFESLAGVLDPIIGAVGGLLDAVSDLTFGLIPNAEDTGLSGFSFADFVPDSFNLDLTLEAPDEWEEVVFIQPKMTLEYKTAVSTENVNGFVSVKGVGNNFSDEELADLQNFIIPPEVIPFPLPEMPSLLAGEAEEEDDDPATIHINMRNPATGQTARAAALFQFPTLQRVADRIGITKAQLENILNTVGLGFLPLNALGIMEVFDDSFEPGTTIEYTLDPDEIELLKNNLIGLGCTSDALSASKALYDRFQADIDAAAAVKFGDDSEGAGDKFGISGLDSVASKIDRGVPDVTQLEEQLQQLLDDLQEDPTTPINPLPFFEDFFRDVSDFTDKVLCVGASSIESEFTVNKKFVLTDEKDRAIVSLLIKDSGGNDLLVGGLVPGSQFRVDFFTNLGTIGPVEFDADTGTFFATITSDTPGIAEVTASFVVRDKVCTRIKEIVDLEVVTQIVTVEFVPERTQFPRVRRQPQYIHSRGGRSRR